MTPPFPDRKRRPSAGFAAAALLPFLHTTFYPTAPRSNTVEAAVDQKGIVAAEAQLLEDGKPGNRAESSVPFRTTTHGVSAVLAIDSSGSVKGKPFEAVKAALLDFVSAARPQDRIAILSFADTVDVRQPFTSDKAQLSKAIEALQAGGKTTLLNEAVSRGVGMLKEDKANERRRLVVITDGRNEGPGPEESALEKDARQAGVPIDCVGITRLSPRFLAPMQSLAAASGGAYTRVRGYEELRGAMKEGIADLMEGSVLTFRLVRVEPDGASHSLQVTIPGRLTEAAQVFLPSKPLPPFLIVSAGFAGALLVAGVVLIVYSRRRQPVVAAAGASVPAAFDAVPAEAPPPAHARTPTVFSPPARAVPKTVQIPAAAPRQPAVPKPPAAAAPAPAVAVPKPAVAVPVAAQPSPQATQFRHVFETPTPAQPTAWLRATAAGTRHAIDRTEVWIGAGDGNHITVDNPVVSRNHACIQWSKGDLYLFDNRSTNGTRVNDKRMEAGARTRLQPGDRIEIGHMVFLLEQ